MSLLLGQIEVIGSQEVDVFGLQRGEASDVLWPDDEALFARLLERPAEVDRVGKRLAKGKLCR